LNRSLCGSRWWCGGDAGDDCDDCDDVDLGLSGNATADAVTPVDKL
jgi:hypothetical protein